MHHKRGKQHIQYQHHVFFKAENLDCTGELKRTKNPAGTSSESEVYYLTPCLLNHSGF